MKSFQGKGSWCLEQAELVAALTIHLIIGGSEASIRSTE